MLSRIYTKCQNLQKLSGSVLLRLPWSYSLSQVGHRRLRRECGRVSKWYVKGEISAMTVMMNQSKRHHFILGTKIDVWHITLLEYLRYHYLLIICYRIFNMYSQKHFKNGVIENK